MIQDKTYKIQSISLPIYNIYATDSVTGVGTILEKIHSSNLQDVLFSSCVSLWRFISLSVLLTIELVYAMFITTIGSVAIFNSDEVGEFYFKIHRERHNSDMQEHSSNLSGIWNRKWMGCAESLKNSEINY